MDEDRLRRFVERISQHREQAYQEDREAFRDIAMQLGFSRDELDEFERHAENLLAAAAADMLDGRILMAIQALEQAQDLLPWDQDLARRLALARVRLYESTPSERHRAAAYQEIETYLQRIDPTDEVLRSLLSSLTPRSAVRKGYVLGTIGLGFLLGIVVVLFITSGDGTPEVSTTTEEITSPAVDRQQSSSPPTLAPKDPTPTPSSKGGTLPVTLEGFPDGIGLEVREARLNVYTDSAFIRLEAAVLNEAESAVELDAVRMELELLTEDGVAKIETYEEPGTHHPTLRPGDRHHFARTIRATPEVTSLVIRAGELRSSPAPEKYGPSRLVEPVWDITRPTHLTISVRERQSTVRDYITGQRFKTSIWEVTNTGSGAIRSLRFSIKLLDTDSELIFAEDRYVTTRQTSMLPGETRLLKLVKSVPPEFQRYEISVIEIE